MVLVSHLFSIGLRARRKGLACTMTRRTGQTDCPDLAAQKTPESVLGLASAPRARQFQNSVWDALERSFRAYPSPILAQWNGMSLTGRAATAFARAKGISTLYFELGNIEPKLFVDPAGANAQADLAAHPEKLDQYPVTDSEIEAWIAKLTEQRLSMASIPQAARRLRFNPWFIVDFLVPRLTGATAPRRLALRRRIAEKAALAFYRPSQDAAPDRPFLLLPLQVSHDSNLLVLSDYGNLDALRYALEQAHLRKLLLVVKPHPAETNAKLLKQITALCVANNALMTRSNVTRLILDCEEVITINSTVGMEARLLNKPATILGQSLYGAMTRRQIAVMAMRHLVNFAPFGNTDATEEDARKILSFAGEAVIKTRPEASQSLA
jgi:capsular polysaccharide export protein